MFIFMVVIVVSRVPTSIAPGKPPNCRTRWERWACTAGRGVAGIRTGAVERAEGIRSRGRWARRRGWGGIGLEFKFNIITPYMCGCVC